MVLKLKTFVWDKVISGFLQKQKFIMNRGKMSLMHNKRINSYQVKLC